MRLVTQSVSHQTISENDMAMISAAEKRVSAAKRLARYFKVAGLQFVFVDQTKIAVLYPLIIQQLQVFQVSDADLGQAGKQLHFTLFSIVAKGGLSGAHIAYGRGTQGDPVGFNAVQFSRISLSEVIALAVEDVDLEAGTVHVRRASVVGEFKVPKERSRLRTVELIDPALELMREILADASQAQSVEIKVIQRDNITSKKQKVRFLFRSSTSGLLWNGKTLSNWFTSHLRKAEIRHRGANQCRHTFASQMLSSYVPVEWVARQLGHADTTMVRKHYGRWIPRDTKSMAGVVSGMLGFRPT